MTRTTGLIAFAFAACIRSVPMAAQAPAGAPDSIYPVAQVEVRPEALNGEELGAALFAKYPPRLREAGVSGQVTVRMVVGSDGLPRNVELVSSTNTLLNEPTLEVASLLRFSPAQIGGRPVPARIIMPVPWVAGPPRDTPGPDVLGAYELKEVNAAPRPIKATYLRHVLERNGPQRGRNPGTDRWVEVRMIVNPDGTVSHGWVTHSIVAALDAPTLDALQRLRFHPAQLAGRSVPVWVTIIAYWPEDAPGPRLSSVHTLGMVERQPQPTNVEALQRALERAYPRDLRDAGVTGTVRVRLRVDTEGVVTNRVVIASTDERFNEATLSAIRGLRFRPAAIGRKRVPVWVELPIQWQMYR